MPRADAGFTLLELMIVVTIVSVLAAIGIPSMNATIRNNRLAGEVNDMVSALGMARGEALKRGLPVIVCRSSAPEAAVPACGTGAGWHSGWVVFVDANSNSAFDAGEAVLNTHPKFDGDATMSGNNNVANRVIFTAQGVVGAGGIGGFLLEDPRAAGGDYKGRRLICMAMTGRTRLFKSGETVCPP